MNCYNGIKAQNFSSKTHKIIELCLKVYLTDNILKYGDVVLLNNFISSEQLMKIKVNFQNDVI